jgi:hypothetical protein
MGWFKLHFETLCNSYGIKHKPTTIKNPQANAICERIHQVLGTIMRTSELDMADSVEPADIDTFIDNAAWAIHSTYHTVLKASPGAAIFGRDMLLDIPFVADWKKMETIGNNRLIAVTNAKTTYVLTTFIKLVIKYQSKRTVYSAKQSPSGKKNMDHNNSSYEWNYQDSMRNQIKKNVYLESNTI